MVTRCWWWSRVILNKCLVADCPCAESPAAAVWLMKNNKSWKRFFRCSWGERESARETLRASGRERKREGGREGGRRRETQSALRLRAEAVRVPAAFKDVEEVHCSNCHRLDFSLYTVNSGRKLAIESNERGKSRDAFWGESWETESWFFVVFFRMKMMFLPSFFKIFTRLFTYVEG